MVLRDDAVAGSLVGGPLVYDARVYSAARSQVERVLGFRTFGKDVPVYVLFVRYAYRDYTGRTHRAEESAWDVIDARTLVASDVGYGGGGGLRRLGRSLALRL
jgi:hypothetical protein